MVDIKRLMNTETGRIIISVIMGLGVATLFRKICRDKNCMEFYGVPMEVIKNKVYQHEDKCFQYQPKSVRCDAKQKRVIPIKENIT